MQIILITGSSGVIGRTLSRSLATAGHQILPYDLAPHDGSRPLDILDPRQLAIAARSCDGIVHLAAVSRVADGEHDPSLCRKTNERGTGNVLRAASQSPKKPWVLFVSSREVYGHAERLPVDEAHPLAPINTYGSSKMRAEEEVMRARSRGQVTAIVRLTNVYGSPSDHPERVVPAFIRAVLRGTDLRVDGADCCLDLVHIDDVVVGIGAVVALLERGEREPPVVQLVSGESVTLGDLACKTIDVLGRPAGIDMSKPGVRQVQRFVGDPSRARHLLGWSVRVPLDEGIRRLADEIVLRDEASLHGAPARRSAR